MSHQTFSPLSRNSLEITEFKKEEFVQNYLQYRWLDETRSKLVDRVFIITAALLLARLQFSTTLMQNPGWLLILHIVFIVVTGTFGYSIIRYRRQQREHGAYINACRNIFLENNTEFQEYKSYIKGKPVYLTLGIETAVAIIAALSPFVLTLDRELLNPFFSNESLAFIVVIVLPTQLFLIAIWLIIVPYAKYNFKKEVTIQRKN